ncbi:arylsulfatase [Microbacterium hominis]|uniref:arylsulfatase n=1 Tax=Microbacterium hominis TaxID=162426 RepID=UPI0020B8FC72|nr:arylsulfatase [Microbacterium hominis]
MDAAARGYERFGGVVGEVTSASQPWWPAPPAPTGPNVVVILVDDLGFSDLGAFGGEIDTPHIDRLAETGYTFTNYHTAPMCSPSRAALMTGLNPHRAGFGYVAHIDPGYPGYSCELPADAPTLAESLRAGGYATFMVGKWHLTVESRLHDGAEKSSWPLQRGFDRYYGCMDGFTSLHHPHRLVSDNSVVEATEFPDGYFLTDDLTDRAIGMIDDLRQSDAAKPFFLYFAHTAVHGPIQAKPADMEKYRGRYSDGWDALRAQRFARQRARGIVPAQAVLPDAALPEYAGIPAWEDLSAQDQLLFARHMEAYAAAVDEIDQSVGRLTAALEARGELEDTLIVITSDNGGTAEGGPSGTRSYFAQFGIEHPVPAGWETDIARDPALIGGPRVFSHYPAGWARVSNTPFRAFKGSTYEGGVHAPLIVSWPAMPEVDAGSLRHGYAFVSDLAPTILDLVGVERLAARGGLDAVEPDGRSFATSLLRTDGRGRAAQLFECGGERALYRDGLKAVLPLSDDPNAAQRWELYDLADDPTETRDLAADRPYAVRQLATAWRAEAWRSTVFPLEDDRGLNDVRPETELALSQPVRLQPFRPPLERFRSARLTVLRSFEVELDLENAAHGDGVLIAHGDQGGGYLAALLDGRVRLSYNAYGRMHRATAETRIADRAHVVLEITEQPELRCSYRARVDGVEVARIDGVPMLVGMAPFTGISVGYDYGSPVDWDLHEQHGAFRLTGAELTGVRWVPGERSAFDPIVIRSLGEALAHVGD